MGGFTTILLKDCSQQNIDKHNARLKIHGVPEKYSFYSERDIIEEYEYYKAGKGIFPTSQFPLCSIISYKSFKKYWSPQALGEVFCPEVGMFTFDCYFGRTSKPAMRAIAKYLYKNHMHIDKTEGSFGTFLERGPTKKERKVIEYLKTDY